MPSSPFAFAPDPESVLDVLAFVLCPPSVFAPDADGEELEAIRELMLPAKTEAVRKWTQAEAAKHRS